MHDASQPSRQARFRTVHIFVLPFGLAKQLKPLGLGNPSYQTREREVCTCETAEPLKTAQITASGLVLHVQRFATCPRSKPKHLDDSIFRHFLEHLRFRLTAYLVNADCIGLPITLQITARVTWSGWPRIARSHTEISLSLSELLHRDTNLACKRE